MTRSQHKTLILGWLDDSTSNYFTDSLLNIWINMAQRQVQMHLLQAGENYYMKPVETTTVASQADYTLPSDFMVEHRLELVLSGTGTNEVRQPLAPITTNQQDLISIALGQSTDYYIKKDRVTLSPTPDNTYTLRLYYSPMTADLSSDSDTPDVPEQYQEMVSIYAAYNGFIKDDRMPTNLQLKMQQFETLMKQMAEDRTQDMSRQVVQISDYDYGSFF